MSFTTPALRTTAVTAAALLALTACGGDNGNGDDNGNGNGEADGDVITIGIAGEVPYSYLNSDGEPEGATVALAEEIFGERMGYTVEAELTDWDNLIPGLNAGQFDAISAGMSVLPERCAEASFGEPELMYTTALLVEEGNPYDVHDLQDIADAQEAGEDFDVITLTSGVEADFVEDLGIDASGVGSADDGVDMVSGGRADVFALTAISLNQMSAELDGLEVTDAFSQEIGAGATVFTDDNDELREEYNEHLADLKENEDEYLDLIGEFGFTEDEVPPLEMTSEELCEGDIDALNEEYLDD